MPAILFLMKDPKYFFESIREVYGKKDVIFSGPKLSCASRNTPKSFRKLYGTVFVLKMFLSVLRQVS